MEFNKEEIYDEQIQPLMTQIIKICKDNEIPLIASFCYKVTDEEEEDFCTTCITAKDDWLPEKFNKCRSTIYQKSSYLAFTITETKKPEV